MNTKLVSIGSGLAALALALSACALLGGCASAGPKPGPVAGWSVEERALARRADIRTPEGRAAAAWRERRWTINAP